MDESKYSLRLASNYIINLKYKIIVEMFGDVLKQKHGECVTYILFYELHN
jgi:hypothetical protein